MQTLREQALEALARAEVATKGPWEDDGPDGFDRVQTTYITARGLEMDLVTPWELKDTIADDVRSPSDKEFILHAREDVPVLARGVLDLLDRVASLESLLKTHLPKCAVCRALATRGYYHCVGHHIPVCDTPRCLEEDYCDVCGQVWYGDDPNCEGYTENGPCTGTSKHPETSHVSGLHDFPHAAVIRSLR